MKKESSDVGSDSRGGTDRLSIDHRRMRGSTEGKMSLTYEIVVDFPYLQAALARFRKQRPKRVRQWISLVVTLVVIVGAWGYAAYTHAPWEFVVRLGAICGVGGMLGGGLIAAMFARIYARRRLQQAAQAYETSTVVMHEGGLTFTSPNATANVKWSAYERAVRFPDGIMLLKGRVTSRWLPDKSLKEGTSQQATDLVASKLPIQSMSV